MPWQSNTSPQPPVTSVLQVPSAEAVRQAALEASWRRDKRVAQRRLFWRWTLWYIQSFYAHALVVLVLAFGAVHFSAQWFAWPRPPSGQVAAPSPPPSVEPAAPTAAPAPLPEPSVQATTPDWVDEPMTLHASQQLGVQTSSATTAPAPSGRTDTLPLKPETWLHSKEP